jgi:predicted MPP superfamily phosphohydrolase
MKSNINLNAGKKKKRCLWIFLPVIILLVVIFMAGTFYGRFNFKYETIEIDYKNLPASLDGLTIIHISDLHLRSFNNHKDKLRLVIDSINAIGADIIVNTGDFVTILWSEMKPFTDILASLKARYGVYAIPGNHDTGLYSREYNTENFNKHLDIFGEMLGHCGHIYLEDTSAIIIVDTLELSMTGVATYGRIPDISYGDIDSAMVGTDSADFSILLTHDPNHWVQNVKDRNDINLTLSGHTHGMQLGIPLPGLRLSPAGLLYPAWGGLYGDENNYLYVNRGLGTIGIPARIGMPPEITIIRLKSQN